MAEEYNKEPAHDKESVHKNEDKPLKHGDAAALEGNIGTEIMQMLSLGYSAASLHSPHNHLLGYGMAQKLATLLEPPHLARERKELADRQLEHMLTPNMKPIDVKMPETKPISLIRGMH
jgi:hypothetical protein